MDRKSFTSHTTVTRTIEFVKLIPDYKAKQNGNIENQSKIYQTLHRQCICSLQCIGSMQGFWLKQMHLNRLKAFHFNAAEHINHRLKAYIYHRLNLFSDINSGKYAIQY